MTPEQSQKEADLANAIQRLAEKYGCKVDIDFADHKIEFDCPSKDAELDLAMELKKLLDPDSSTPE